MNKILEIEDLYFKYDENYIIKGLNLTVNRGEFVAIIGENGCGKSTLLNLILKNLKKEKGKIKLFGDDIEKDNHYRDISFISQNSVMNYKNFPTTVEEVILNHLIYLKKDRDVQKYLKLINLENSSKKSLSELSGGQLQRVGLCLALIKNVKLIILDEPTTGIDSKFVKELFELLKDLSQNDTTIIIVTHEVEKIKSYADRIFYIKDGKNHDIKNYKKEFMFYV